MAKLEMPKVSLANQDGSFRDVVPIIVAYSLCSSMLLLVNKVAMKLVPVAFLVTVIQLLFAAVFVVFIRIALRVKVDELEWTKVRPYMLYIAAFSGGIYCNLRALEHSNVETIIIFRSCSPLLVSICDYLFLGRELPSSRSIMALVGILVGAMSYVYTDKAFHLEGFQAYFWAVLYFFIICFEMTYGKVITNSVPMASSWGPVYYTNVIGILSTLFIGLCMGDFADVGSINWTREAVVAVSISAIIGIGISYSAWSCRAKVTATTFTLVGVVNKLFTIFLNCLMWDAHASPMGLFSLLLCLACGTLYQQAPMRPLSLQS